MFYINTIIAWDAKIYHKHKDTIITTLLLALRHISNRWHKGGALTTENLGTSLKTPHCWETIEDQ
jgi:hypothetical protein